MTTSDTLSELERVCSVCGGPWGLERPQCDIQGTCRGGYIVTPEQFAHPDLVLTRAVTVEECHWLDRDFAEGEMVYEYTGAVYGCITDSGVACSLTGDTPFFELPIDALRRYPQPETAPR
jgi:hypothetical protein